MIRVGTAFTRITPELGRPIQGATVNQVARSVRDELEANALYLEQGRERLLLVSCDVVGLAKETVAPMRAAMGAAAGLAVEQVIVSATHTHSGPSLLWTNPAKAIDHAYIEWLQRRLVALAGEAAGTLRPARAGWGRGHVRLGYNRRLCWADGSHSMFGDAQRGDFTGLEGPDDAAHLALFFVDEAGKPIAVVHNNTVHPTSFYGCDFFSADFPGGARAYLRERLGEIPVLFLNGAFGDISGVCNTAAYPRGETAEQRVARTAHLAAGETFRLLHEAQFREDVTLASAQADLELAVRQPSAEQLAEAQALLARDADGESVAPFDRLFAFGTVRLHERFGDRPRDTVSVHAVRIGDVGWAALPCELFCQFGLDIKRRSPAPMTGIIGEANGAEGYVPTGYGALGGGYSGRPLEWTRYEVDAGYRLVDTACALLWRLWRR